MIGRVVHWIVFLMIMQPFLRRKSLMDSNAVVSQSNMSHSDANMTHPLSEWWLFDQFSKLIGAKRRIQQAVNNKKIERIT